MIIELNYQVNNLNFTKILVTVVSTHNSNFEYNSRFACKYDVVMITRLNIGIIVYNST